MPQNRSKEQLINQLQKDGVLISPNIIDAMRFVPRHLFVPENKQSVAYEDRPLLIGENQTISAPHMNALMCEILQVNPGERILEIGTGSGYHSALLSHLAGPSGKIYSIERHQSLALRAKKIYKKLNFSNISVIIGDGTLGYPSCGPYDKILVTAAGPEVPIPLINQLSDNGGILCIPLGKKNSLQALYRYEKNGKKIQSKKLIGVMFVPLYGKYAFKP